MQKGLTTEKGTRGVPGDDQILILCLVWVAWRFLLQRCCELLHLTHISPCTDNPLQYRESQREETGLQQSPEGFPIKFSLYSNPETVMN